VAKSKVVFWEKQTSKQTNNNGSNNNSKAFFASREQFLSSKKSAFVHRRGNILYLYHTLQQFFSFTELLIKIIPEAAELPNSVLAYCELVCL